MVKGLGVLGLGFRALGLFFGGLGFRELGYAFVEGSYGFRV